MINIKEVYFKRENKVIFDKISIEIKKDWITAIIGPSGCGKTTLLKLITGQIKPTSGLIEVFNQNICIADDDKLYNIRKNLGLLYQNCALFSDLNVYDNIAFPIREHTDINEEFIKELVLMKLHAVVLRGSIYSMPSELSLGMARRIALARAIALDPKIIMYDEPFAGQDPISMTILIKLIILLNKLSKMTTVIVSHDILETLNISDYVYVVSGKKIIASGTPEEIKNNDNNFVRNFLKKGKFYK